MEMVPVVDKQQKPLMPCSEKRARQMVISRKATPFWKKGVFCIRLNVEPSARNLQQVVVGIDPGSKKEGLTVKSKAHTYLNVQADAITWVKEHVKLRRIMRKARRHRKTPYRECRNNRTMNCLPPSTKARWQWKLRLITWFSEMYPITDFIVEDANAITKKNCSKWNGNFSPIKIGKNWFYSQIKKFGNLSLRKGWDTKTLRDKGGLGKSSNKMRDSFDSHCVDSWVLANEIAQGHTKPENKRVLCVVPLRFHRRQLHRIVPSKGGKRPSYGGTRSLGLKRGSLVQNPKYGLAYVGGSSKNRISLHSLRDGKRLSTSVKVSDCKVLSFGGTRAYWAEV